MSLVEKEKNPIAEQSRQWLMQSLLDLMSQKDYARITVTEIAEHALLSRRTFYRIFDSKEQVLQQCFLERCEDYITYFQKDRHYTLEQIVEVFFYLLGETDQLFASFAAESSVLLSAGRIQSGLTCDL